MEKGLKEDKSAKVCNEFEFLSLSDDFLFSKVMGDPEVSRITLEKILGIPISKVIASTTEHVIDLLPGSKGVRLDVYVADEKGDVYNCEMQTGARKELPRRSRYYHGCMDLNLIGKGERYETLAKAFVIFICTFDPFEQGRHVYTFKNICEEAKELSLEDGTCTIFLNTKGTADDVGGEMLEFLAYVENTSDAFADGAASDWVRTIHQQVKKVKQSKELEAEYVKSYLTYLENIDEGIEIGIERGIEQGIERGMEDLNRLNGFLLKNGMLDELKRSLEDPDYQCELLQKHKASNYVTV